MKNTLIAILSVVALLLVGVILWQGALKEARDARENLITANQRIAEVEKEVVERKLFWSQVYGRLASGGELRQVKASIFDGNPPIFIKGKDGKIMKFDSDGKIAISE